MTERINQNYTVTQSNGIYTITYTGGAPSEAYKVAATDFQNHPIDDLFYFGSGLNKTLLAASKCTSPVGANRAALITAIQALFNTTTITPTLNITPSSATDQVSVVNNGKVILLSFPEPSSSLIRHTFPTTSDTVVGRATTDTLTNKTLTSPSLNLGGSTKTADAALDVPITLVSNTGVGELATTWDFVKYHGSVHAHCKTQATVALSGAAANLAAANGSIPEGFRPLAGGNHVYFAMIQSSTAPTRQYQGEFQFANNGSFFMRLSIPSNTTAQLSTANFHSNTAGTNFCSFTWPCA
jgi:hypothetical protein